MSVVSRLLTISTGVCLGVTLLSTVPFARETIPFLVPLHTAVEDTWSLLRPGGALHPANFLEHHGHLFLEGGLLLVIMYLLFQSTSKPSAKSRQPLTEKEVQELCDEWQPEPLAAPLNDFQQAWLDAPLVVTSPPGRMITVNGHQAMDFASLNFLGIAGDDHVQAAAQATILKYGVGSCGPRGFYGTLDVHLDLETRLAAFVGTQEAILYSYDLTTLPSIIPAFANRKDLIIMDDGCCWALRNGCTLSRARIITFRHNDLTDLEAVLQRVAAEDAKVRRPLNRRFILVEGVYVNFGDVAPLAGIVRLKEKYKYRLIVDDSIGFGVLGATGRGSIEAAGLHPEDVEILGASLGNATASIGGFCAGDREIVDHQRLDGKGYCFSASLPPYLAAASIAALDLIESNAEARKGAGLARSNGRRFRKGIMSASSRLQHLRLVGEVDDAGKKDSVIESPLVHVALHPPPRTPLEYHRGDLALQRLVADALEREGVLFAVSKYSSLEGPGRPRPTLRVALSAIHGPKDVDRAVAALVASAHRTLSGREWLA